MKKGTEHIVRGKGEALSKSEPDSAETTPTRQIGARFGGNNPEAAKRSSIRRKQLRLGETESDATVPNHTDHEAGKTMKGQTS